MSNTTGTLFALKRYAIHDGPSIRTTVFLKGCALACWWCHNPEGIGKDIQLVSSPQRCIACGECIENCTQHALHQSNGDIQRDQDLCTICSECVETCPALVHEATGWETDVNNVMTELLKDKTFFDEDQGGVTFSGGEPLSQPDFLLELLTACGTHGIHRTVDSSGYAARETVQRINSETDLWLLDLKHMDSGQHKKHTGVGNELILGNIQLLSDQDAFMRIRIPLIPGFNAFPNVLDTMARFISTLKNVPAVDILPYHDTAKSKYEKLGLVHTPVPSKRAVLNPTKAIEIFNNYGIPAESGG